MERLKAMSLKKALFTMTIINICIAMGLSVLSFWGLMEIRMALEQKETVILSEGSVVLTTGNTLSKADSALADVLSVLQLLLPVLIFTAALVATVFLFYRWKLKEPIAILQNGAEQVIAGNLDFTVETPSEDELGQLCTAFETMRSALYSNNQKLWEEGEERRRLNAAFAHNLRNPITVLKGSVKLAEMGLEQENEGCLKGAIARITQYTERIESYVELMSSVQQFEDICPSKEKIATSNLLEELENAASLMAMDKGIAFSFKEECSQREIYVDKSVLFQITENLVANALRFAKESIEVTCSLDESRLSFTVQDDGPGFPPELLQKGIRPFQKGCEDAKHFGMGLYSSMVLCRSHGGLLQIANRQCGAWARATLNIMQ